jgi:AAA family ATP:ADP antiporter
MTNKKSGGLSLVDRFLSLFTKMGPGEGKAVLLFALYAFLLLVCYYILKTTREVFILTGYGAETASYAIATQALLLLFIVPLYGMLFRAARKIFLIRWVTVFFAVNVVIFYLMGRAQMEIGFIYYVFVGIFGVMVIAQFWAFAADCFNVKSGQRLFPVIMIGASAGALGGSQTFKFLTWLGVSQLGMLLAATVILLVTLALGEAARRAIPQTARGVYEDEPEKSEDDRLEQLLGGFAHILRNRYLILVVILVILLNWVNSTGEVILKAYVKDWAAEQVAVGAFASSGAAIGTFFGDLYFWVNLFGFLLQAFVVSRIYRYVGVAGALMILPVVAAVGYSVLAFGMLFIPIFSLLRMVKIVENSVDYSIMNTTRQALFLPLSRAEKYEAKTAIDTFFWRLGDMIQGLAFFVGLNWLGMSFQQFFMVNAVLAAIWVFIAFRTGRHYRHLVRTNVMNVAPELRKPIPDVYAAPGGDLLHEFDEDTFVDTDPGDVMTFSAQLATGEPLPSWVRFEPDSRRFRGRVPKSAAGHLEIEVVATDFEGLSASGTFFVSHTRVEEDR